MLGILPVLTPPTLMTSVGLAPMTCTIDHPPRVTVEASTRDIAYDFTRSERELSATPMDYQSPYPAGSDVITRGLRADKPEIALAANWNDISWSWNDHHCLSYDKVTVTILLQPRIFIAREVPGGICKDTILGHERHHVEIDRAVLAEYLPQIRVALEDRINRTGAFGPVAQADVDLASKHMLQELTDTLVPVEKRMFDDLSQRQQAFDSRQEYDRVSAICRGGGAEP